MPRSLISNLDQRTGQPRPAAPDQAVVLSSGGLGWRGIAVELHRLAPDAQPEHCVGAHRLMIHLGGPTRFEWREGGGPWRGLALGPNDVTLLGEGTPNEPRWRDPFEFLAVAIDPAFLGRALDDAVPAEAVRFAPQRGVTDADVARFAALLRRELAEPRFAGGLFGEMAALALAMHLLRAYPASGTVLARPRGRLTGLQLQRVTEYLHANLAEDVGLEALAAQAYVSPFHFARLFRRTTGLSPHRFVLELRVARAKALIGRKGDLNLAEIAVAAGFFDQAHFGRTFKRLAGVTPAAYRAA